MKLGSETGEDETTALHRRGSSSTSKPDYCLACSADDNLPNARVAFIGFNCKLSRWQLFLITPLSICCLNFKWLIPSVPLHACT